MQTGRAMLKCPVEGVEFASKAGGGGGKGKKKKKGKVREFGGGLPSASKDIRKASQAAPSSKPSGDVNDLMAKFNRK